MQTINQTTNSAFVPCAQCKKDTLAMMGEVCGKCCKANHKKVTGKK